jgi:hypothetical protein
VGAGADRSRERASSMGADDGFPDGRSKGVGFRPLQMRRRYGRWVPEQTVRERESVVDGRRCRISGREEQGRQIPVSGGEHDVLIAFFLLRKNENKMTRGKKTEERRMRCACVEALIAEKTFLNRMNATRPESGMPAQQQPCIFVVWFDSLWVGLFLQAR